MKNVEQMILDLFFEKRKFCVFVILYRAFHIILDYLQYLPPKYAHNTRKT